MNHLLFIGHLWPEPASSAAGYRTLALLKSLSEYYQVHFACTAEQTEYCADLQAMNIQSHTITLNDSGFDQFIEALKPDIVFYDRFISEEQFAPRVHEHCPDAINILDTQDLHFLRRARQTAVNKNQPINLYCEDAVREIAAILRCDLSLIISSHEMKLLTDTFNISPELLHYCPFMLDTENLGEQHMPAYNQREHFVMIGNFLHPPNWDAVQWSYRAIWPQIKKKLPEAQLYIYGAYPSEKVMQLHKPEQGFIIKGRADHALTTLSQYRVNLAPLRFGAGLKGKIVDGFLVKTPCVTTPIGQEGISGNQNWGGLAADTSDNSRQLADYAIKLYSDQNLWEQCSKNTTETIEHQFNYREHADKLLNWLSTIQRDIKAHRNNNFYGRILRHNLYRSQYYMSKWIEEKNTPLDKQPDLNKS